MSQRKIGVVLSYLNIVTKNLVFILYTPFLLKFIGQAEYGLYQMTNSVIMSLTLLSMGFSGAYVRFYMRFKAKNDEEGIKKLNGMYLLLFIGMALLALILGGVLVGNTQMLFGKTFTPAEIQITKMLMLIMTLNVALSFPSSVFDSYILAHEEFKFQQSRQLAQTLLAPILTVPLVMLGFKSIAIVVIQTLITLVFLYLNIRYARRKLAMGFTFSHLPVSLLKEVALFSFFIFLNQVIDLVNNNVPNFILGMFTGAEDVATYAVASQIKGIFFMLSIGISAVFIPLINEKISVRVDTDDLTDLMIQVGRVQLAILSFILGGFIVIGKYFIRIWAGDQNILAYWLVLLMILPTLIPLSQNLGIEIQRAMNKHMFRSVVYFIFALLNIIITIIGTRYFGLIGASLGYVTSVVCANGIIMNWYYQTEIGLDMPRYWKAIGKVSLPFILSTVLCLLVQQVFALDSLFTFILFGGLYTVVFAGIYLLFIANDSEKRLLRIRGRL